MVKYFIKNITKINIKKNHIKVIILSRNPTAGAFIGEPHALAYTSRTAYVSYA